MVYSEKFVVCILVDGIPQNDKGGKVHLSNGQEYSIRLRNKNDRRAVAHIKIDGEKVSDGGFVVNANDYVDIHRRSNKDVAFKFVSIDSPESIDHGKNEQNQNTGIVEVKFHLEKSPKLKRDDLVYVKRKLWDKEIIGGAKWDNNGSLVYNKDSFEERHVEKDSIVRINRSDLHPSDDVISDPYEIKKINLAKHSHTPNRSIIRTCELQSFSHDAMHLMDGNNSGCTSRGITHDAFHINNSGGEQYSSEAKECGIGVTVEGSSTGQMFHKVDMDIEEASCVIKIRLLLNKKISENVTYPSVSNYSKLEIREFVDPSVIFIDKNTTEKDEVIRIEQENLLLRKKIAEEENRILKQKLSEMK